MRKKVKVKVKVKVRVGRRDRMVLFATTDDWVCRQQSKWVGICLRADESIKLASNERIQVIVAVAVTVSFVASAPWVDARGSLLQALSLSVAQRPRRRAQEYCRGNLERKCRVAWVQCGAVQASSRSKGREKSERCNCSCALWPIFVPSYIDALQREGKQLKRRAGGAFFSWPPPPTCRFMHLGPSAPPAS